jgi:hypothetical protein
VNTVQRRSEISLLIPSLRTNNFSSYLYIN